MEIVTLFTVSKTRDFALPLDRTDIENEFGLDKIVLSQSNIIVSLGRVKPSEKYEVIGDIRVGGRGSLPLQESLTSVLISKSDTFHEGFLTKKGKIIKSWKKRWFVIHRGEMSYYKKQLQQSPQANKKTTHKTGSFTVEKCLCGPIHLMSDSKEFAFRITTPKRSYFLVASNAHDFEIWKEKIILNGGKWHAESANVLIEDDGSVHIQPNPSAPLRTPSNKQIIKPRRNSGVEHLEISLPIEKKVQFVNDRDDNPFKPGSPDEKDDMTFFFNKKTGVDFIDIHKGLNKELKIKGLQPIDKSSSSSSENVINPDALKGSGDALKNSGDNDENETEIDLTQSVHKLEDLIPSLTVEEKTAKPVEEDIGTFFIGKNSVDLKKETTEDDKAFKEENEFPTFVLHRGLDAEMK